MVFDLKTTHHTDLRSFESPWQRPAYDLRKGPVSQDFSCNVLIVGAGITGGFLAEHLTTFTRDVVVLDREPPGFGSTAASTSMLQWEIDASLTKLSNLYGFERAAFLYQQSLAAVAGLSKHIQSLSIDCNFRDQSTLYLANGQAGGKELLAEHALRRRAGLPGDFLDHKSLQQRFGLDREAALHSPQSADADPIALAQGLLTLARQRGARLLAGNAIEFLHQGARALVGLENGRQIEADHVVLATGYALPDFLKTSLYTVSSSWAIATHPQKPKNLWPTGCLLWEASDTYLYARTTEDNRVIIGGEDETLADPVQRDQKIVEKSKTLKAKLQRLLPQVDTEISVQWAGAFGQTIDGLPLIGPVPSLKNYYGAYGYGGNGITFSFMASRMIARMMQGQNLDWFDFLALNRKMPS